jgi:hypothetical protein
MVDAIRGPASVLIDRVAKGSSNESCGDMERSLKLGQTGTQCISDCEDRCQKIAKRSHEKENEMRLLVD